MARRRHTRPVGRPRKLLEDAVHKNLVGALELGVPLVTACEAVSISKSTFYKWMQRGYDEFESRAAGVEPDEDERVFHDLFCSVQEARSKAAVRNIGVIQKAAQGGAITEKTVRKYRDPDTGSLVEEETVKRSAPDWRASAWYLERTHRNEFGKGAEQVEISGAGGGPIAVTVDAEDLSRRLSEHIAVGAAVVPALPAGTGVENDTETE